MRGLHARRIHIAFALAASLSLAGFQEETEIARWIDDLGHEEIARRSEAEKCLLKAGAAAMPALRKAIESGRFKGEPENRARLEKVHRLVGEVMHDADQRPWSLALVTFEDRECPLGEVAAELERQTPLRFKLKVDAALQVRVGGKEQPIRQVLDSIEVQLGVTIARPEKKIYGPLEIKPGRSACPRRIYLPGATYNVRRGPPVVHDKLEGWVLETELADPADAKIDSVEVLGSDGKALPLIKCPWCSPGRMFVKTPLKESVRVCLRGNVLWHSQYELKIDAVESPQRFQVGRYEIFYEFLKTRVEPSPSDDEEWHSSLSLSFKYKSGAFWQRTSATRMECRRVSKTHADWCGKPVEADSFVERYRPITSSNWNEDEKIDPADLEAVKILFSKTIKEPFDREIVLPPSN